MGGEEVVDDVRAVVVGDGALTSNRPRGIDVLDDVSLEVSVELGGVRMRIRDILRLHNGAVIELDKMAGEFADVYVADKWLGRGEITAIGDAMAVRVADLQGARTEGNPEEET